MGLAEEGAACDGECGPVRAHTPVHAVGDASAHDDVVACSRVGTDAREAIPTGRILLLSAIVFAVQFGISLETAYVIPLFAELSITERFSSLLWAMGPIAGLIMQPIIGNASDRCTLRWGRRRPFILALALGAMIGLLLIPNGEWLGRHLGGNSHATSVALCIAGVLFLDFSCDSVMGPLRAYLFDALPTEQHDFGNSVFGTMAGFGASLGYVAGGVEWGVVGRVLGSQLRAAFVCGLVVAIVCTTATLCSIPERPLRRPRDGTDEEARPLLGEAAPQQSHVSLRDIAAFIGHLPRPIARICMVNALGWIAFLSFVIFFTDYVGIVLYSGNANLPEGDPSRDAYDEGVRIGSLGLAAYSVGVVVASIVASRLVPRTGVRVLYCTYYLCFFVGVGVISLTESLPVAIAMCFLSGTLFSALFTMPFMCLSAYETARGSDGSANGLNVAVVGMMQFVGQVIVSAAMGNIVQAVGDVTIAMYTGSLCAVLGACATYFLVLGRDLDSEKG